MSHPPSPSPSTEQTAPPLPAQNPPNGNHTTEPPPQSSYNAIPISNIKNFISVILDFSNFSLWENLFLPVFESHSVMPFIDGTSSCPPSILVSSDGVSSPNPSFKEWKRIDAMVLSWIQATVSTDILRSLNQPGISLSARQAWLKIFQLYLSQAHSQEVQLKREFINFKKQSLSMMDDINQMKVLADALICIGVHITEKDLITQLCIGLNQDHMPITTTLSSIDPTPTFIAARYMLLNYDAQLRSFSSSPIDQAPTPTQTVFYAPRQPPRGRGRPYQHLPSRGRHNSSFQSASAPPPWRSPSILGTPASTHLPILQQAWPFSPGMLSINIQSIGSQWSNNSPSISLI